MKYKIWNNERLGNETRYLTLTDIKFACDIKNRITLNRYRCFCGNFKLARHSDVLRNHTKSCGCALKSPKTKNPLERFFNKVLDKGHCHEWQGSKQQMGHGLFKFKGKLWRAHRFAYMIHNGKIDDSLCVLHKCDNPSCVNPNHLIQGTRLENSRDRDKKGRHIRFSRNNHPRTKVTQDTLNLYIHKYIKNEISIKNAAIELGISYPHAWRLLSRAKK